MSGIGISLLVNRILSNSLEKHQVDVSSTCKGVFLPGYVLGSSRKASLWDWQHLEIITWFLFSVSPIFSRGKSNKLRKKFTKCIFNQYTCEYISQHS